MFTGIVEDIGRIKRLAADRLEIISCLDGVKPGDSIAVNGVCLTVTGLDGGWFFDLMPFTLRDTALAGLPVGAAVNLERAMPADGRFGGHFVSGHVDEASPVEKIDAAAGKILWIRAGRENKKFLARKGSIAVDGVSLTIQDVREDSFAVSLVGHTLRSTTLQDLQVGSKVNIEYDLLLRYIQNFLPAGKKTTLHRFW